MNMLQRLPKSIAVTFITLLFLTSCSKSDMPPTDEDTVQSITVSSITPQKSLPHTVVIIKGSNFSTTASDNVVSFNGATAKVNSSTTTELVVTVPASAISGKVTVSVNKKSATSASDFVVKTGITSDYASLGGVDIQHIVFDSNGQLFGQAASSIYKVSANTVPAFKIKLNVSSFTSMATDPNGNLIIAPDYILKIDPQNNTSILAGVFATGGLKDGTGAEARFAGTGAITNDLTGNFYCVNAGCVRKITPLGVVTTLAGNLKGENGFVDGKGTVAKFGVMTRIAVDPLTNDVYVIDSDHFRIRKISQDGTVVTILGNGKESLKDGDMASGAQIFAPQALAFDKQGNLFFSDADFIAKTYKIRMMNRLGEVSTLIYGNSEHSLVNGNLNVATTARPLGLAFDADDNLYIVNSGVNKITKVTFN